MVRFASDCLILSCTLIGSVMGAGFVSGAEVSSFFAVYGASGIMLAVWAGMVLTLVCLRLFSAMYRGIDPLWVLFGFAAPLARRLLFVFYLTALAVMLSSIGEIAVLVNIDSRIATMSLVITLFVLSARSQSLRIVHLFTLPCVVLLSFGAATYSLVYHARVCEMIFSQAGALPSGGAFFRATSYVSYNALLILPALSSLHRVRPLCRAVASVLSGIVFTLLLTMILLVVLVHSADSCAPSMVMLSVTEMQHDVCFYAYTLALTIALTTSGLSALCGASAHLPFRRARARTFTALLLALSVSQTGFSFLVGTLIPALGALSVLFMIRLLVPVHAGTRPR